MGAWLSRENRYTQLHESKPTKTVGSVLTYFRGNPTSKKAKYPSSKRPHLMKQSNSDLSEKKDRTIFVDSQDSKQSSPQFAKKSYSTTSVKIENCGGSIAGSQKSNNALHIPPLLPPRPAKITKPPETFSSVELKKSLRKAPVYISLANWTPSPHLPDPIAKLFQDEDVIYEESLRVFLKVPGYSSARDTSDFQKIWTLFAGDTSASLSPHSLRYLWKYLQNVHVGLQLPKLAPAAIRYNIRRQPKGLAEGLIEGANRILSRIQDDGMTQTEAQRAMRTCEVYLSACGIRGFRDLWSIFRKTGQMIRLLELLTHTEVAQFIATLMYAICFDEGMFDKEDDQETMVVLDVLCQLYNYLDNTEPEPAKLTSKTAQSLGVAFSLLKCPQRALLVLFFYQIKPCLGREFVDLALTDGVDTELILSRHVSKAQTMQAARRGLRFTQLITDIVQLCVKHDEVSNNFIDAAAGLISEIDRLTGKNILKGIEDTPIGNLYIKKFNATAWNREVHYPAQETMAWWKYEDPSRSI